jgi:cytochrome c biogenesis protein CcmG/thiol:disulfide interchange protein DsbE
MRKLLTILLCAVACVAIAADRRAPGFSLVDTKGVEHDLADYRGKPVLLSFMKTTCPHCAAFSEKLQEAQDKYGSRIAILAIVTPPDDPGKVQAFMAGHHISFPILFDSGQMTYSYVLNQSLNLPQLFMIDATGTIKAQDEYGPLTLDIFDGNGLAPAIDRLLKK